MRAYEIQNKPGFDALTRTERPDPTPGQGQVVVRVRAASLNYRDLMVAKGTYGPQPVTGMVPLSDGAGEVAAVGEGVTRFRVGDRVCGTFFATWDDGPLTPEKAKTARGGAIDGMLAEYVALPETGVVASPEHLSDEEAATLPCAAVTAWNALFEEGRLTAGQTVLLQGTGGVSLFALQFARAAGARVILTSSSDEKRARAEAMGADATINYRTTPEWEKEAFVLSGRQGVDHVVEVGGAGTLNRSLRAVRHGGTVSLIGVLAGGAGEITTALILQKNIRLQGIYVGSRRMFENMNRALTQTQARPVVDRVFGFDEARVAYEYLESGAHFGKVVIRL